MADIRFVELPMPGAFEVQPFVHEDIRGSFIKTITPSALSAAGLSETFVEDYYSISKRGVIRGLHFQVPPEEHAKLVYCVEGEVLDVLLDLRVGSPTYGQAQRLTLDWNRRNGVLVPVGVAHGFQALSDHALLYYKTTTAHSPACDKGIRWDSVGVDWPIAPPIVSERDKSFPSLADFDSPFRFAKTHA